MSALTSGTPEKGWRPIISRWKTSTARPNRSWLAVRSRRREVLAVQLGRRVFGHAHPAAEDARSLRDLERVAVDQGDDALLRHHDVLLVDVAHDVPVLVDRLEGDRAIPRRVEQEAPVGLGEILLALGDAVEVVDLEVVDDPGHQDAVDNRGVAVAQRGGRPGRDLEQVGAAQLGHRPELVAAFLALRLAVELGDQVGPAHDVEDRTLAADREGLGGEADLVPQMVTQLGRVGSAGHRWCFAWRGGVSCRRRCGR